MLSSSLRSTSPADPHQQAADQQDDPHHSLQVQLPRRPENSARAPDRQIWDVAAYQLVPEAADAGCLLDELRARVYLTVTYQPGSSASCGGPMPGQLWLGLDGPVQYCPVLQKWTDLGSNGL